MERIFSNLLDTTSMHPASIKRVKKNYEKNYYAEGLASVARTAFSASRSIFPIASEWNKIGRLSYEDTKERTVIYVIYYAPFLSSDIKVDRCGTLQELEKKVINHFHCFDQILMIDMEIF